MPGASDIVQRYALVVLINGVDRTQCNETAVGCLIAPLNCLESVVQAGV
jgi:hypothetical protein